MTDNIGYGKQKRREGNLRVLAGEQTFRCFNARVEVSDTVS